MGSEQALHTLAQGRVAGTGLVEEGLSLNGAGLLQDCGEQRFFGHGPGSETSGSLIYEACRGLPGPGLLAHVITNKYAFHLPLYRHEEILAYHGVTLSRSTLCGWMARVAELFDPLYNVMFTRVRGSRIIWTDDTTVSVWDPTLPRTRIGQVIAYAQSNWTALCRYPEHGELSIDNNLAERMLRAQAIGRRNWTFLGSDRGGHTAAVLSP